MDIVTVKELLRHANISVPMRYAHSNDETKRRAVERLGSSDKVVTIVLRTRRKNCGRSPLLLKECNRMPRKAPAKKATFGIDLIEGMKLVLAHQRGKVELEQVWPRQNVAG